MVTVGISADWDHLRGIAYSTLLKVSGMAVLDGAKPLLVISKRPGAMASLRNSTVR
jgi:hypothetical protein